MNLDSGTKFEYDPQISEEVIYEMIWNMMYLYQLINNLSFDQEKELRIRLICQCQKRKFPDNWISNIWLWLYGLDTKTQRELILGKMSIIQLLKEEQQKYFEYSINANEVQVKKEWANYFNKYAKSEILYDNMSIDIKNIMKVNLKYL